MKTVTLVITAQNGDVQRVNAQIETTLEAGAVWVDNDSVLCALTGDFDLLDGEAQLDCYELLVGDIATGERFTITIEEVKPVNNTESGDLLDIEMPLIEQEEKEQTISRESLEQAKAKLEKHIITCLEAGMSTAEVEQDDFILELRNEIKELTFAAGLFIKGYNFTNLTLWQINHILRKPNTINYSNLINLVNYLDLTRPESHQIYQMLNQSTGFNCFQIKTL